LATLTSAAVAKLAQFSQAAQLLLQRFRAGALQQLHDLFEQVGQDFTYQR
jgi:hypothetical protein